MYVYPSLLHTFVEMYPSKSTVSILIVGALCLWAACDVELNPSDSQTGIRLEHVRTIAIQETDARYLGDFITITVQNDPFRIYIPDSNMHRIAVLDSTGQIVRIFGQRGQGPGEFERPMHIVRVHDRLYVKEANRYSIFDTSGTFQRRLNLPEGVYDDGRWSLNHHGDQFFMAVVNRNEMTGLLPTSTDTPLATLNDSLDVLDFFGTFPELYQNGHYPQWPDLDITTDGILALGFGVLPDVYLYDVSGSPPRLLRHIEGKHPSFRPINGELPPGMPIPEKQERALNYSSTLSVSTPSDTLAVLHFANRNPGYYDNIGSEEYVDHYAIVVSLTGKQKATLELPGPIMDCDEKGRLYIRHSNIPDQRKIGVYRLTQQ